MSYSDFGSFSTEDPEKIRKRQAECIRNVSNFSKVESYHMMDKSNFIPELLDLYLKEAGPKVEALMDRIRELDEQDLEKEGKHFKHMIFTDVKSSTYGAKLIGSAFVAKGYHPAFHVQGLGFALHPDEKLLETSGQNFGVLMSKNFYDRPMSIKFRKHLMETYNQRPENVQGNLVRFIILDQGFKEGIDLFDVKYVHLFEPLVVKADEKQAIGRGTRFCGQSGLKFHPKYGWPLYVFRYEVQIPTELHREVKNAKQMFELYLQYANIDLRKVVFAAELEKAAIEAAADKDLTSSVHQFKMDLPPPILKGGAIPTEELIRKAKAMGVNIKAFQLASHRPEPPSKKMDLNDMHKFVRAKFRTFAYPNIKLENQCGSTSGGASIVEFTPTQNFVRHYFQPSSAYKGMLLFHSVGTGKTCSAIATATTSFEREGYNILWVTRHTLKNDIWKNMYKQVCSLTLQEKMKDGTIKLPANISNPKKYLPENWIEPISYKQFSNLLLEKNKYYEEIVKRNGKEDPLRKTLVIIDEAHKLYSPTVVGSEKPRTDILEKMIQNSYEKSGKDSVRILLMTATPYTEDAMEMIKLLNLLREKDPLTTDFEAFKDEYLDAQGYFKPKALVKFQDKISGYISYLNRSGDARNFAYPVLQDVYVDLTHRPPKDPDAPKEKPEDKYKTWLKDLKERMAEHKGYLKQVHLELKDKQKGCKEELKQKKADMKEKAKIYIEQKMEKLDKEKQEHLEKCDKLTDKKQQKACVKEANAEYKKEVAKLREQKKTIGKTCVPKQEDCVVKLDTGKEKELQEHQEQLGLLNDEKMQVDAQHNVIKADLKAFGAKVKELRKSYNEKISVFKEMRKTIKKQREVIRKVKDKDRRKELQKEFRATVLKEFKEKQKEIKQLRADISYNLQQKRLLRIKSGKALLKDVSQFTALDKRCKVTAY